MSGAIKTMSQHLPTHTGERGWKDALRQQCTFFIVIFLEILIPLALYVIADTNTYLRLFYHLVYSSGVINNFSFCFVIAK
jgi:hypothetical protein